MPRLKTVKVRRMLGEYDHEVRFGADWEFVIIYGPNGVGKTKLLELIYGALMLQPRRLASIPFEDASLEFKDGSILAIRAHDERDTETGNTLDRELRFTLRLPDRSEVPWHIAVTTDRDDNEFYRWIERSTSWSRVSFDLWEDSTDGELVDSLEIERRFGSHSPARVRPSNDRAPEAMRQYFGADPGHLIETQRLLTPGTNRRAQPGPSGRQRSRATVAAYAEDLTRQLAAALAVNSRTTQQLDRTFPARLLNTPNDPEVTDESIREKYAEQNQLRSRLAQIALIGGEADVPLPQRTLEPWERKVLSTYLKDTDQKLATFEELLAKLTLFQEIINRRFLRKTVRVTVDEGLLIERRDGDAIRLSSLSSGEQHELILIYDLLFNVEPGSIVLIDEPEISLHVAWQKSFLDDIVSIAALASFQFIVATHSPQIINKWWSRAIALGPSEGILE